MFTRFTDPFFLRSPAAFHRYSPPSFCNRQRSPLPSRRTHYRHAYAHRKPIQSMSSPSAMPDHSHPHCQSFHKITALEPCLATLFTRPAQPPPPRFAKSFSSLASAHHPPLFPTAMRPVHSNRTTVYSAQTPPRQLRAARLPTGTFPHARHRAPIRRCLVIRSPRSRDTPRSPVCGSRVVHMSLVYTLRGVLAPAVRIRLSSRFASHEPRGGVSLVTVAGDRGRVVRQCAVHMFRTPFPRAHKLVLCSNAV